MVGRIVALLCSIVLFFVLAAVTGEWLLVIIIPVVSGLFLLEVICNQIICKKINIETNVRNTTGKMNQLELVIRVENCSILPIAYAVINLEVYNRSFHISTQKILKFSVGGKSVETYEYEIESDFCGQIDILIRKICVFDHWGISYRTVCKNIEHESCLYPKYYFVNSVEQIMRINYEKERFFAHVRNRNLSDLLQYREYQKGDNLKHINWKLSNRLQEYYIREFDTPTDNQILLTLDLSNTNKDEKNYILSVFFSICMTYAQKNIIFHILWNNTKNKKMILKEIETKDLLFQEVKQILQDLNDTQESVVSYILKSELITKYAKILYITGGLRENERRDFGVCDNVTVIEVQDTQITNLETTIKKLKV